MGYIDDLPGAGFGDEEEEDWREFEDEVPDDDGEEEDDESITELLGFDPKEVDEEKES